MVIYSFYSVGKEGRKTERLRDHVLISLELVRNESKLVRFGRSLNENFVKILNYSIIFHDFGKIFHNKYCFNEKETLSFEGHEIISCWGANEYLKKLVDEDNIAAIDRRIIILAILLHHHPMSVRDRFERLKVKHGKVDATFFDLFYEELEGVVEQKEIHVEDRGVSEISEEVCGKWGLLKNSRKDVWMSPNPNVRKTFLLAVQALVAADYYSAHKKRGDAGSKFIDVIDGFVKFYTTPSLLGAEG